MEEACSRAKTVLFVSHNLAAIESLCTRGIVLQHGRVAFDGRAKDAINFYSRSITSGHAIHRSHIVDLSSALGRPPRYQPQLKSVELYCSDGTPFTGDLPAGAPLKAIVTFDLETACTSFDASIAFDSPSGFRVCTAHSAYEPDRLHEERSGRQTFVCDIASLPLVPGEYKIGVGLDIGGHEVDWVDDASRIRILQSDFYGTGVLPIRGSILLHNRWRLGRYPAEAYS